MKQALAHFERHVDRPFSHSSTSIHYLSDIRIFIHAHGSVPPRNVTAADIDAFIDAQLAAGMCAATINRRLASLHYSFEFLAYEEPESHWPNPVIAGTYRSSKPLGQKGCRIKGGFATPPTRHRSAVRSHLRLCYTVSRAS